ncbi:unnamed protein product [Mytilus edulis]|uniref:C-type lectin domain-containing protein n=1 Tax=Mytilus edulis TaxID=6550 RepID=A0A8S3VG69_MYTED|nr:unnamed protein product [Mytilus edulis]
MKGAYLWAPKTVAEAITVKNTTGFGDPIQNDDCVEFESAPNNNWNWDDDPCDRAQRYMCEFPRYRACRTSKIELTLCVVRIIRGDGQNIYISSLHYIFSSSLSKLEHIESDSRERLHDLDVTVGPTENEMILCAQYVGPSKSGEHLVFECNREDTRFVKLMINGREILHVAEVKVHHLSQTNYEMANNSIDFNPTQEASIHDAVEVQVPFKIKEKILEGKFIELHYLLRTQIEMEEVDEGDLKLKRGHICIEKDRRVFICPKMNGL